MIEKQTVGSVTNRLLQACSKCKKIKVWANGDHKCYVFNINQKDCKNWKAILNHFSETIYPSFGAIKNLVELESKKVISCYDELDSQKKYIGLGGKCTAIKLPHGGYKTNEELNREANKSTPSHRGLKVSGSKNFLEKTSKLKYTVIYVAVSGLEDVPKKAVFKHDEMVNHELVRKYLATILKIPQGVRAIYTTNGKCVEETSEFNHGSLYVAVPFSENFVKMDYIKLFKEKYPFKSKKSATVVVSKHTLKNVKLKNSLRKQTSSKKIGTCSWRSMASQITYCTFKSIASDRQNSKTTNQSLLEETSNIYNQMANSNSQYIHFEVKTSNKEKIRPFDSFLVNKIRQMVKTKIESTGKASIKDLESKSSQQFSEISPAENSPQQIEEIFKINQKMSSTENSASKLEEDLERESSYFNSVYQYIQSLGDKDVKYDPKLDSYFKKLLENISKIVNEEVELRTSLKDVNASNNDTPDNKLNLNVKTNAENCVTENKRKEFYLLENTVKTNKITNESLHATINKSEINNKLSGEDKKIVNEKRLIPTKEVVCEKKSIDSIDPIQKVNDEDSEKVLINDITVQIMNKIKSPPSTSTDKLQTPIGEINDASVSDHLVNIDLIDSQTEKQNNPIVKDSSINSNLSNKVMSNEGLDKPINVELLNNTEIKNQCKNSEDIIMKCGGDAGLQKFTVDIKTKSSMDNADKTNDIPEKTISFACLENKNNNGNEELLINDNMNLPIESETANKQNSETKNEEIKKSKTVMMTTSNYSTLETTNLKSNDQNESNDLQIFNENVTTSNTSLKKFFINKPSNVSLQKSLLDKPSNSSINPSNYCDENNKLVNDINNQEFENTSTKCSNHSSKNNLKAFPSNNNSEEVITTAINSTEFNNVSTNESNTGLEAISNASFSTEKAVDTLVKEEELISNKSLVINETPVVKSNVSLPINTVEKPKSSLIIKSSNEENICSKLSDELVIEKNINLQRSVLNSHSNASSATHLQSFKEKLPTELITGNSDITLQKIAFDKLRNQTFFNKSAENIASVQIFSAKQNSSPNLITGGGDTSLQRDELDKPSNSIGNIENTKELADGVSNLSLRRNISDKVGDMNNNFKTDFLSINNMKIENQELIANSLAVELCEKVDNGASNVSLQRDTSEKPSDSLLNNSTVKVSTEKLSSEVINIDSKGSSQKFSLEATSNLTNISSKKSVSHGLSNSSLKATENEKNLQNSNSLVNNLSNQLQSANGELVTAMSNNSLQQIVSKNINVKSNISVNNQINIASEEKSTSKFNETIIDPLINTETLKNQVTIQYQCANMFPLNKENEYNGEIASNICSSSSILSKDSNLSRQNSSVAAEFGFDKEIDKETIIPNDVLDNHAKSNIKNALSKSSNVLLKKSNVETVSSKNKNVSFQNFDDKLDAAERKSSKELKDKGSLLREVQNLSSSLNVECGFSKERMDVNEIEKMVTNTSRSILPKEVLKASTGLNVKSVISKGSNMDGFKRQLSKEIVEDTSNFIPKEISRLTIKSDLSKDSNLSFQNLNNKTQLSNEEVKEIDKCISQKEVLDISSKLNVRSALSKGSDMNAAERQSSKEIFKDAAAERQSSKEIFKDASKDLLSKEVLKTSSGLSVKSALSKNSNVSFQNINERQISEGAIRDTDSDLLQKNLLDKSNNLNDKNEKSFNLDAEICNASLQNLNQDVINNNLQNQEFQQLIITTSTAGLSDKLATEKSNISLQRATSEKLSNPLVNNLSVRFEISKEKFNHEQVDTNSRISLEQVDLKLNSSTTPNSRASLETSLKQSASSGLGNSLSSAKENKEKNSKDLLTETINVTLQQSFNESSHSLVSKLDKTNKSLDGLSINQNNKSNVYKTLTGNYLNKTLMNELNIKTDFIINDQYYSNIGKFTNSNNSINQIKINQTSNNHLASEEQIHSRLSENMLSNSNKFIGNIKDAVVNEKINVDNEKLMLSKESSEKNLNKTDINNNRICVSEEFFSKNNIEFDDIKAFCSTNNVACSKFETETITDEELNNKSSSILDTTENFSASEEKCHTFKSDCSLNNVPSDLSQLVSQKQFLNNSSHNGYLSETSFKEGKEETNLKQTSIPTFIISSTDEDIIVNEKSDSSATSNAHISDVYYNDIITKTISHGTLSEHQTESVDTLSSISKLDEVKVLNTSNNTIKEEALNENNTEANRSQLLNKKCKCKLYMQSELSNVSLQRTACDKISNSSINSTKQKELTPNDSLALHLDKKIVSKTNNISLEESEKLSNHCAHSKISEKKFSQEIIDNNSRMSVEGAALYSISNSTLHSQSSIENSNNFSSGILSNSLGNIDGNKKNFSGELSNKTNSNSQNLAFDKSIHSQGNSNNNLETLSDDTATKQQKSRNSLNESKTNSCVLCNAQINEKQNLLETNGKFNSYTLNTSKTNDNTEINEKISVNMLEEKSCLREKTYVEVKSMIEFQIYPEMQNEENPHIKKDLIEDEVCKGVQIQGNQQLDKNYSSQGDKFKKMEQGMTTREHVIGDHLLYERIIFKNKNEILERLSANKSTNEETEIFDQLLNVVGVQIPDNLTI